jgi:hypothetical protein
MEYVGFDLGKVNSQICLITEDGELIEKRLKTERETLAQFFVNTMKPAKYNVFRLIFPPTSL